MSDAPDNKPDYRSTVFLPKTDFPMKAGLPQKEPAILARWESEDLYQQVRAARQGREKFILHDGPPYANGDIHIGHALNHILKDMVVRTQTLLGKDAPYVPGWDCHGLPIEWKVEEQYRKKKRNKDEVPVKEFRAECRAYAQHWVDTQREQLKRLGIGGQWDKPYLTMNFEAEATIVSELYKFAASGQLYRGAKPVMWSPVEKTALAEAEIEYEDITSTQIDVAFKIVEAPNAPKLQYAKAVVWTTTPWTIPVNQAIAFHPEIDYEAISIVTEIRPRTSQNTQQGPVGRPIGEFCSGDRFIVATSLRDAFVARMKAYLDNSWTNDNEVHELVEVVVEWTGKGAALAGAKAYHPMAGAFEDEGEFFDRLRPFLPGEFVTTDSGTGLVHMSPDHGEDDFELCKANGIDPVFAVEADGKYREDWAWLGGQGSVINNKFNAPDGPICSDLRDAGGLLAASADYQHSYPHSWRSKAKVIYRCTPQWFVAMDKAISSPLVGEDQGGGRAASAAHESLSAADAAGPHPNPSPQGGGATLRQLALKAISDTRWVPEKGENRIRAMVEGRPDWVLSRQRAWGVPIALFVDRKSGQPLVDGEVNARIVAAIRKQGVDAWGAENAAQFLGPDRNPDDFEMVTDILDVWFDSGCTHVFTLESGHWPEQRWPADLYLEGSDQHRGWFQSSLLESCGTRGRAPYNAVLTHGFTMDAKGLKMSKSVGNTIDPLKVMETNGADIIRLWALSVDYTEDHRIGDEILKGVADQYRKLRNTFRYLLGALEGFTDEERLDDVAAYPELERYMLHLASELDGKLRQAVADFDFNSYVRLLTDFANEDLSAFFFDIRKDCLYCDAPADAKRRAYRTTLDILFHALVRWLAPVLVFTTEEVWGTRYPDAGSVHLLEWPEIGAWENQNLAGKWNRVREARQTVTSRIEPLRQAKVLGSSLEAEVELFCMRDEDLSILTSVDMDEVSIVSHLSLRKWDSTSFATPVGEVAYKIPPSGQLMPTNYFDATVKRASNHKCGRCWRLLPEVAEDGGLCARCSKVVS